MKTLRFRSLVSTCLALPVLITQSGYADYQSTVLSDGPRAYYRLNDDTSRSNINKNSGSIGAAGNFTNTLNVNSIPGAISGSGNRSLFFNNGTSYGMIPFNAAVNPDNTQPFTIEAWFYPTSDQINGGQCPVNNRVSSGFPDRTGWVFFQRAPNLDYVGRPGYEGVGWNCRMYRGSGGASGLDVVSQVPYEVGKWTHVVVVYDPVEVTNATLTMYINGVAANTNVWNGGPNGTDPGYVANPAVTDAALSLGAYNNTSGAGGNPYFGGIDELAFYSAKLTAAQILSHYQNGTNANRATPYDALVKSHNPVAYLRLDERSPGADVALNMGDLRNNGTATNTAEVRHPATGALSGRTDDGAFAYHNRNGNSTTTMPWRLENNPSASVPFTFEAWLRPMRDQQGGQCPVNNRWVGGTGRTGWVIFQRNPNLTYPASEGHGWNFRMFSGAGTGGQDVLTGTDYVIGKWQHLVVTWEPQTDMGDPLANGNNQWQGVLTAYVDGAPVASNTAALYAANRDVTETGAAAADLGIGAYNAASGLGNNPYEGDIDEVAIYNNLVLTPDQILAHYQAGTNAQSGTNYETLVLMAGADGIGTQRLGPKTYLRFNDSAYFPAANSGTGSAADGNLVLTTNTAVGPRPPAYAGFEASNTALPLDGLKQWSSLNNPSALNIAGQITLEAWVKPGATQGETARIISHGPKTPSNFLTAGTFPDNAVTNSTEVFLRIDGSGANYTVGSIEITYTNAFEIGSNIYSASFPIPAGDLGGSDWVHLIGTYDGANWKLYRNGAQVASQPATVGALAVNGADWAIGSTGNGWADNFAGDIDEVAIYDKALTPAQVAAHHSAGKVAAGGPITITRGAGNSVIITWPAGTTLQEATSVNGPYTTVGGSPVSPLAVPATGTKYYRWQL